MLGGQERTRGSALGNCGCMHGQRGRGSFAKNSSWLTHLVSGKTFVRKMVLFLAKKKNKKIKKWGKDCEP